MAALSIVRPDFTVVYSRRTREPEHEKAVHAELARRLARLQQHPYNGEYDPARHKGRIYFVPSDTLVGCEVATGLGITSEYDLFGGVVPHAFVPTKAITHPLLHPDAHAPQGWSHDFGHRVRHSVLRGISVFSAEEAGTAGRLLLQQGPVRIKTVQASAGRGQWMVSSLDEFTGVLAAQDPDVIERDGLVLEEHLGAVATYSVGQVRVGQLRATYCGTQRLTRDNGGATVYGGSEIIVVRGGFEALAALELPTEMHLAISRARVYDQAAISCFPGFFASRRNYDVAQGIDAYGNQRCGVLEQSWRIGGASAAEVAALEAFDADATLLSVKAATYECYGADAIVPPGATLLFQGEDAEVGLITKYLTVEPYGHA